MRNSEGGASAGKKLFIIIFVIFFLAVAFAILYGMNQQKKSDESIESGRSEIVLVKSDDGKIVLTDDLLRSDYGVYVRNAKTGANIMLFIIGGMAFVLLAWFIISVVGFIRDRIKGNVLDYRQIVSIITSLIFLIAGGIFLYKGAMPIMKSKPEDPETATLSLEYGQVTRKTSEVVRSGSKKHHTSRTDYYVYLSDGTKLSVTKHVYDEVAGSGYYYIGKNEADAVFGMYPESEYCMEEI